MVGAVGAAGATAALGVAALGAAAAGAAAAGVAVGLYIFYMFKRFERKRGDISMVVMCHASDSKSMTVKQHRIC